MNTTVSDDDKKSYSKDDEEDTDSNETLAVNMIIDLEDTSMHNDHKDDNDDDSVYSDKETSYEELQNKYSLLYTKWVGLVKLHEDLKDILKKIQEQKDALEERNYELIAQVKDATARMNVAKASKLSVLVCVPPMRPAILQSFKDILEERRRQLMVVELYLLGIEVVMMFNGVKDLKGFKVKQLVPRGSLEELKGFHLCCSLTMDSTVQWAKGVCSNSNRKTLDV
ncbi:hypothetical protein M9H77_35977 [Catharanthus roseus]|uniref:Uncharacterized protein n=1 Tax=Catharanthus roseus TaxID=4058 RepID=A0ACB9ZQI6_CATRO|nr:hypothetical protein M9H77_35977 [Catharanthus roseus]